MMGSGSSKKSTQPANKTAPPKPVANVNKQENDARNVENNTKFKPEDANNTKTKDEIENNNNNNNILDIKEDTKAKEKEKKKNKKAEKIQPRENMIAFEEDSDIDNNIDEVLKIPVAVEYPKPKKKDKKDNKNEEHVNYDQKLDRDLFNSNSNGLLQRNEDLPMTYAQRQQRQQYKFEQDLLIRQKTMLRNSKDWDDYEEEEEEKENLMNKGFDASKFRAVNKGRDGKKDLFKTSQEVADLETPRYLDDQKDMDDFQLNQKHSVLNKELPNYNQSEIDLMNELERDLL